MVRENECTVEACGKGEEQAGQYVVTVTLEECASVKVRGHWQVLCGDALGVACLSQVEVIVP